MGRTADRRDVCFSLTVLASVRQLATILTSEPTLSHCHIYETRQLEPWWVGQLIGEMYVSL